MARTTLAPNSNGFPSQMTKSFLLSSFGLPLSRSRIFSMFRDTKSTAARSERPEYLAAQLASKARLWMCVSPLLCVSWVFILLCSISQRSNDTKTRGMQWTRKWNKRMQRLTHAYNRQSKFYTGFNQDRSCRSCQWWTYESLSLLPFVRSATVTSENYRNLCLCKLFCYLVSNHWHQVECILQNAMLCYLPSEPQIHRK